MFKNIVLSIVISVLGTTSLFAQDLIYKLNKQVIECSIKRIDDKDVKYTVEKYSGETVFTVSKKEIEKIVYGSGEEIYFNKSTVKSEIIKVEEQEDDDEIALDELLKRQNKRIFKVSFFSPLLGALEFGYEASLKKGRSLDIAMGGIGLGTQFYHKAAGMYGKIGYKIMRKPEVYRNVGHYPHLLKGSFVKPEIIISYFSYNERLNTQASYKDIKTEAYSVAFLINMGKQWVFDDEFSFSWSIGVGYAISSSSKAAYYYSHGAPGGNNFPIAFSASIVFGLVH